MFPQEDAPQVIAEISDYGGAVSAMYDKVTLTDEAKKYLQAAGNVELAAGVQLELGAEYVMTVTDCTPLDANNKFNCTIDFRKK